MPYWNSSDGASGGGGKALPSDRASYFLNWDYQTLLDGSTPTVGTVPGSPYISTGVHADAISGGFSSGQGGGYVALGPGGAGLVYSADFFASGADKGGSSTANNPSKPADNTSITLECGLLLKSLTTVGQGVICSKAFGTSWVAPFNALEMNLLAGNGGFIEFGMVDNANPAIEIGTDTSGGAGRAALTVGYHWLALVVDQVAKTLSYYQDAAMIKRINFVTGINLGTGPYMFGGNTLSTNDSANINLSHCALVARAKTQAEIASNASAFLKL